MGVGYDSKAVRRETDRAPAAPDRSMSRRDAHDDRAAVGAEAPPSKTRRKQEMHELQELGVALVALDPSRLGALRLPERLAEAIALARRITRHEGRRRQMQFIGRLMRDIDPGPIRAALASIAAVSGEERARFAAAEAWRDRLLADESAHAEFVAAHPDVDGDALRRTIREAREERAEGRPPHRFRALFRLVARALEGA
jgi:ribosome-associated protein